MNRFRVYLIDLLWGAKYSSFGSCANRKWQIRRFGPIEATLTMRDTSKPDAYSREELLEMLATVRKHEAIQGWKVPEPYTPGPGVFAAGCGMDIR